MKEPGAKKDRSGWWSEFQWTGLMAVLELRYQSPNLSCPRPAALGFTPFHSTPKPSGTRTAPASTGNPYQTENFRWGFRARSVLTFRRITLHPLDICIAAHPQTRLSLHHATLIAFYIISMCFRSAVPTPLLLMQRSSKTLSAFLINPGIYSYGHRPFVDTHYRPSHY